jgi:hypothetical protein
MNLMERVGARQGAGIHTDIRKGDVVRTQTFGLRYRVLRVWHGKAICEPLSQPQWKDHFMFPVAYLVREAGDENPSIPLLAKSPLAPPLPNGGTGGCDSPAVRLVWLRVDWSIWAHVRVENDLTACSRNLRGGEPIAGDPAVPDLACPACLTVLRGQHLSCATREGMEA